MLKISSSSIVAIMLSACFPKPQPPVMAQLPMPTVKVNGEEEVTSEGLTVTLTPITDANAKDFPQITGPGVEPL